MENLEIGGKSAEELIRDMKTAGISVSEDVEGMLLNPDEVTVTSHPKNIKLIRISEEDLGLMRGGIDQVFQQSKKFGMEYCPPDTGP